MFLAVLNSKEVAPEGSLTRRRPRARARPRETEVFDENVRYTFEDENDDEVLALYACMELHENYIGFS